MTLRLAQIADIDQMDTVRMSVKENVLSTPGLVTFAHYMEYLTVRGRGWVCEIEGLITGFAIADFVGNNIWALFVMPEYEKIGIGKILHDTMLDWYFAQTGIPVWLSTSPDTRAERFYRAAGWKDTGTTRSGEIRFEMTINDWKNKKTV
jgi:GNAT superfamily N-acetyltransferase